MPVIYFLSDRPAAIVAVCIVTHMPPKDKISRLSIKRRPWFSIWEMSMHPFDNSMKPESKTRRGMGKKQNSHFSRKVINVRNIITQPQIEAIDFIACIIKSEELNPERGMEVVEPVCDFVVVMPMI